MLKPLLVNRSVTGSADSAEVRLLVAHANTVEVTAPDLGPAGVQAAHNTLVELAKAVAIGRFDSEPLLAPALTLTAPSSRVASVGAAVVSRTAQPCFETAPFPSCHIS